MAIHELYLLHLGQLGSDRPNQVPGYVIRTATGQVVLVDTGNPLAMIGAEDSQPWWDLGANITPEDDVVARLAELQLEPADVDLLEPLTKPGDGVEAEERAAERKERFVDVQTPLIANREPAELVEPRQRPFDDPPMPAKPRARFHALARNADPDPASVKELTTARDIVGLVRVQLRGPLPWATARALDRRDRLDQLLEDDAVVAVSPGDPCRERRATLIGNNMALRARFAAIGRVRVSGGAPFWAGMLALSRHARSQSIWSACSNWSSRARWSRSQTPASCQSRNRRQHVIPEPQPSSDGSISQGMPLLSTKMMPARQSRSGMRGRPPFGFGGSFGSSGPTIVHSSSLTSGLLMPPWSASPVPRFC
jgi:hypothetical protein